MTLPKQICYKIINRYRRNCNFPPKNPELRAILHDIDNMLEQYTTLEEVQEQINLYTSYYKSALICMTDKIKYNLYD
jgi:hypothetical protein